MQMDRDIRPENPIQNLINSNFKLLKNIPHWGSTGLMPSPLLERSINLWAENSQITIEYMQDLFENFQMAWLDNEEGNEPQKGYKHDHEEIDRARTGKIKNKRNKTSANAQK